MASFWWALLIIAGGLLGYVIVKPWLTMARVMRFSANVVIAAAIIYVIQITGIAGDMQIPINIPSVLVAGLLGLPGVALLYGFQLLIGY